MREEFKTVTSTANPLVKKMFSLNSSSGRRREGMFLAEGDTLAAECLSEGLNIDCLFVAIDKKDAYTDLAAAAARAGAQIVFASGSVMEHISNLSTPPGVTAAVKIPAKRDLLRRGGRYMLFENLQEPGNAGAVIRSAAAFGLDGVLFAGGVDIYSPKVVRGSMGSIFKVPVIVCNDLKQAVEELRSLDYRIYAAALDAGGRDVRDTDLSPGSAVIIGNEGNGISREAAALADATLYIPMRPNVESLNAAVAAAVIMWEMTSRR